MRLEAIPVVAFCLFMCVQVAAAVPPNDPCNLPWDLQLKLQTSIRERSSSDCQTSVRTTGGSFKKITGMPALVWSKLTSTAMASQTLALVLITNRGAKEQAELILAHRVRVRWKTTVPDTTDRATVPVVWSQAPGEYRDVYGKKEIRATRPVTVFAGYES